jgi:hypothetical protein
LIAIRRHITANPSNRRRHWRDHARAHDHGQESTAMKVWKLRIPRRPVAAAAVLVGMVSLAIGAHAALNKRALEAAKAIVAERNDEGAQPAAKVALVIGNGHYPDASAPLTQPINDARALSASLRRDGFDVEMVEDASKDDMRRAVDRLQSKVRPHSVVMLFFGGYGRHPTSGATGSVSKAC